MNYKLIKISNKYILVNDVEKVNGDRCIHSVSFNTSVHHSDENDLSHWYKIISEKPDLTLLSDVECDFIGWVNIENLACQHLCYDYDLWLSLHIKDETSLVYTEVTNWVDGYKAAPKFTLDDMRRCFYAGDRYCATDGKIYSRSESFDEFISQPTTWNVEVNDKLQLIKIYE